VTSKILSGDVAFINRIRPHKHKWAWDLYLEGQSNNWSPSGVSMARDIEQWRARSVLSDDERLLYKRCMGFFAGAESLVSNNLLLSIFRVVSDGECRQFIGRQQYEETLHNQTVVYVCDSLDLDEDELYGAYQSVPSIKAKDDFLMGLTSDLARPGFSLATVEGKQEALRNIIAYYLVCEGVFFYSGFAMLLGFGRQGKMPGTCEQIQYTLRDENAHVKFGTTLVNVIAAQEPEAWSKDFREETVEHVRKATELEIAFAHDILPRGVLGMSADLFVAYMQFIANRRLAGVGLPQIFKKARNPFPWLTETIDLLKQKNFFETHVIEYKSGGGLVDDL
jgi:ribonucleoside-diphosphate reductase beta chain